MRDGRTLKAVIPGGSSVPILLPDQLDTQASFDARPEGRLAARLGRRSSCSTTRPAWSGWRENLLHFYRHESCGKCTPCREGTDWLLQDSAAHRARRRADARSRSALEHLGQHRRQDAVRVRRRRRHAGADDAEAFPARVRGAHQGRPLHAAGADGARAHPGRERTEPMMERHDTAAHRPDRADALRLRDAAELGGGHGLRRAQSGGAAAAAARARTWSARRGCCSRSPTSSS